MLGRVAQAAAGRTPMGNESLAMVIAIAIAAFMAGVAIGLILLARKRTTAQKEITHYRVQLAELEAGRRGDVEKTKWVEQAEAQLREAFESLASKALRSNSAELTRQTKGELESLVDPLSKNLKNLEEHVRMLESKREGAYSRLGEQLHQLNRMQAELQTTTTTLAQALRSPTVRGRWGEMQLRRIVEMAGMSDHVDFDEQATGESGRPDMIVRLPNSGVLPIDSKVPLDAYLDAMEASDLPTRSARLSAHAKAMRTRIHDLGLKSYWEQFKDAPDFVVMFVPNESCLGAAFESDPDLLEYAMKNRVLISSPVNLLALLRTVAYGWQQHQVTENASRIAGEGRELHKRVSKFFEHLGKIGTSLDKSVRAYNEAIRSFESRVLPSARRFEDLCAVQEEVDQLKQVDTAPTLPPEPLDPDSPRRQ
jgi:DNA recombination protein RmuC